MGDGAHGSNTVWTTTDGHEIVTSNGECVRAFDFASLGRDSCHEPEMVEEMAEEMPEKMIEEVVPAPEKVILSVQTHAVLINFETDSAVLGMDAKAALNKLIARTQDVEQLLSVRVVGHADTRGETAYNLDLSQHRVDSIIQYLSGYGVKTSSSFAQGEAKPVLENGEENLAASRRAEVIIKTQVKTIN